MTGISQGQQEFVQRIDTMSTTLASRIVELGNLKQQQQGGYLQLTIPDFETATFIVEAERVDWQNDSSYTWAGKILNEPGGYALFLATPEGRGGVIQLNENFYALVPLGGDKAILVKQSYEAVYNADCGVNEVQTVLENNDCTEEYNECAAIIDVLVLVTNETMNFFQGLGSNPFAAILYAGIGIETVNLAFQNSDIPNKRIRWELARFDFDFNPIQDIDIDIANLINDVEAQQLRDSYRADVVIMLTNHGYFDFNGRPIFGSVKIGEIPASSNGAFAIVEVPFMLAPRWTFAHEFAHLLGARHNRITNGGNDNTDICAHAWRLDDGDGNISNDIRTILALSSPSTRPPGTGLFEPLPGERILNYSNPNIEFNGNPTGTSDSDNSRIIRNLGCEVSEFRAAPELGVTLAGTTLFCDMVHPQTPKTYSAWILPPAVGMPGLPPYSYEWSWNESGIFDGSQPIYPLGNAQQITISSVLACPHFFLHLKVTSSDQVVVTETRKINTFLCSPPCFGQPLSTPNTENDIIRQSTEMKLKESEMLIFPNPSSGRTAIRLNNLSDSSSIEIKLFSVNGELIKVFQFDEVQKGQQTLPLNLNDLSAGLYNCHIQNGKEVSVKKLIITH